MLGDKNMAQKAFRRFKLVFLTYDWSVMEFFGATAKIMIGLYLLQSQPAFKMISGYATVANENYWGWGLVIVGLLHFIAVWLHRVTLGTSAKFMLYARRTSTFIGMSFWVWSASITYQQSAGFNIVVILFGLIGIFMLLNFIRLWIPEDSRTLDMGRPQGLPERRQDHE